MQAKKLNTTNNKNSFFFIRERSSKTKVSRRSRPWWPPVIRAGQLRQSSSRVSQGRHTDLHLSPELPRVFKIELYRQARFASGQRRESGGANSAQARSVQ